jgi:hypothetical protein
MGFESEARGVIPTGYESERAAGFDHDAKHGDSDERPAFTDPCAAAGFSRGHRGGGFHPGSRGALGFIGRTVRRFMYHRLKRVEKAVVLRFLEQVSGYSRQQLTRLVKRGAQRAPLLKRYRGSRTSFATLYTVADVLLLAHTDSLAWDALRARHEEAHGAGVEPVWRSALRAPGRDLGRAPVQPAPTPRLSTPPPAMDQDSLRHHPNRDPPRPSAQQPTRVPASRQPCTRASRTG